MIRKLLEEECEPTLDCRFCRWFYSTTCKRERHEKTCKRNPTTELFKQNRARRRRHQKAERKKGKKAKRPQMKRNILKDDDTTSS
ncbi:hypothetical protein BLNAU_18617 [Blattamonas nauphoetae]|uniref:Uncharacterized protein n=1 Tax=Blattamonas nauphoetae TaxID=2049346 RepID=A0ABQ9X6B4_9EUKA|nr:hypothetical protein BLNAU_18617 [Blattamonas nauphoetae]